jgi:hypothetical protein
MRIRMSGAIPLLPLYDFMDRENISFLPLPKIGIFILTFIL